MSTVRPRAPGRPRPAWLLLAGWLIALWVAMAPAPLRAEALGVSVGIAPVAGMVERIGGDRVAVDVLVPPGQDPHAFAPTPRQVLALRRAKLLIIVGLPFEEQLARRVGGELPGLRVVDAAAGVARRRDDGACDDHEHHRAANGHDDHGHAGDDHTGHDHAQADPAQHRAESPRAADHGAGSPSGSNAPPKEFLDPHVWLAPPSIKTISAAIADALAQADPPGKEHYAANLRQYHEQIDAADRRMAERLAPHRGKALYVFHPALGYFADAYGLRQEAIETGGKAPNPRQLREVIARARADRAKLLIVEPQFDRRGAEVVARAIGARLVVFDPLGKDVLGGLESLCESLAQGL